MTYLSLPHRLHSLSLATATLLLTLLSPISLSPNLSLSLSTQVQAQTAEDQLSAAQQLLEEGIDLYQQGQMQEALNRLEEASNLFGN